MSEQSLVGLLSEAGWTMIPLYGCSILALAVTVRKALQFRRGHLEDRSPLESLEVDPAELPELARRLGQGSPLARVMARTALALADNPSRAEGIAQRAAMAELDELEQGMSLLSFVAQVAPLFGLLGTVLGMVDLFSGMEAAGAHVETSTLSSGIWKALLTTAVGLIVAIPTLGVHAWLSRRLERLQLALEEGAGRLLDAVLGGAP
jgi:biopolymer transport protein ExbB